MSQVNAFHPAPEQPAPEDLSVTLARTHDEVIVRTRETPHLAVAAAFAAGAVLGGGIPTWAIRMVGITAARVAAARAIASLGDLEG